MVGWSFQIPNEYNHFLALILEGIPIENYYWKLNEDDIYITLNFTPQCLFHSDKIDGKQFKEKICLPSYYVCFAKLQAFSSDVHVHELFSFEEYVKSDCELIILVTDGEFVEIYSKDKGNLDKIRKNVLKNKFSSLRPILQYSDKEITSR